MTTNEPPPYPGDDPGSDGPRSNDPGTSGPPSGGWGAPGYGSTPPPEGAEPPPPPWQPSAPGGSNEPFSAPDAIGWGWRKFTQNVGPILLAVLIFVAVYVAIGGVSALVAPSSGVLGTGTSLDFEPGSFITTLVVNVLASGVGFIVSVAFARAALDVTEGRPFDIGHAFGRINVLDAFVAGLIVGVPVTIGFALFIVPGLIVSFFAYFTSYYVADGSAPIDALKDSFALVAANLGGAILLAILSFLVVVAGVLALCVGVFVAVPVTMLAAAHAYRRFRGQPVAA